MPRARRLRNGLSPDDQGFTSQTYVAVAPDGLDPCDLRRERGGDAVRAADRASPADVRVRHQIGDRPPGAGHGRGADPGPAHGSPGGGPDQGQRAAPRVRPPPRRLAGHGDRAGHPRCLPSGSGREPGVRHAAGGRRVAGERPGEASRRRTRGPRGSPLRRPTPATRSPASSARRSSACSRCRRWSRRRTPTHSATRIRGPCLPRGPPGGPGGRRDRAGPHAQWYRLGRGRSRAGPARARPARHRTRRHPAARGHRRGALARYAVSVVLRLGEVELSRRIGALRSRVQRLEPDDPASGRGLRRAPRRRERPTSPPGAHHRSVRVVTWSRVMLVCRCSRQDGCR